jgi:hypothetical protein
LAPSAKACAIFSVFPDRVWYTIKTLAIFSPF